MFTTAFALAALERAVKTFAQVLAALLVADGTGLVDTAWGPRLSVAGMAAVVSLLTSVASGAAGNAGPSLTTETTEPVPVFRSVPDVTFDHPVYVGRHKAEEHADEQAAGNDHTRFPYTTED